MTPTLYHCLVSFFLVLTTTTNLTPHGGATTSSADVVENSYYVNTISTTMIFPLYHYPHKNSSRRFLQSGKSLPNARMTLHDDLLRNGYYTTRLWIGTPPQMFALIVDTGSTVTYVPCATCQQCGRHQDPKFQPDESSTYHAVKCNVDCTCDSEREYCIYERQYAEMSSSSGVLGEDIVSFGNLSELVPQRAVFGCENMETGDLYSQHADGIMGLGRGDLSIVDQLVDKKVINDSFSLCYGGMDVGGGAMILGGLSPPADMVFAKSDPGRSPYYNIELKELHVAGKMLSLSPQVFNGKHGTVLDSGTTYAYLPEAAFLAFKDAVIEELQGHKQIPGLTELHKYYLLVLEVDMVFGNKQKLTLSPENYLFRHAKESGAYCLGVFQNGKDPTTLLGGIVVRNTLVTYDREKDKIGFWKTNCSELWQRLQLSDASPPISAGSEKPNSTAGISPTVAPSGPAVTNASGEKSIGRIIFSISLNINITSLEPHISELTDAISKELDAKAYQVHLVNFISDGNGTLLKWSVSPAGSSGYMSNATATDIIARLAEQKVHLPEKFGSYKLVEWNVELTPKRTWWQQHTVVVLGSVFAMLVLGLFACGGWYAWRRHQQQSLTSYKPVDAADGAAPEQELQPL
ncbi:hypothetical protein Leryth_001517 [Lithospermum erythrorhizon]|nr:hypothetical protein Leryth_001517 [Lithospermum erythrorhizon]